MYVDLAFCVFFVLLVGVGLVEHSGIEQYLRTVVAGFKSRFESSRQFVCTLLQSFRCRAHESIHKFYDFFRDVDMPFLTDRRCSV